MKRIICLAVSLILINAISNTALYGSDHGDKYCAKLQDGKVVVMHDKANMASNVTLENGTVIRTDGTVIKKDGKQFTLKAGECVNKDGELVQKHDKMKDHKTKEGY